MSRRHGWLPVLALGLVLAVLLPGCGTDVALAPACSSARRLTILAQAVPTAAYVPCIDEVPQGWTVEDFDARDGRARFTLLSDRAGGRPVRVELLPECDLSGAVPSSPRTDGVRTAVALDAISPRFAGTRYDVFAGGCVTYEFDFPRGPHIALMEDLQSIVGLESRRELRLAVERQMGIDIGP